MSSQKLTKLPGWSGNAFPHHHLTLRDQFAMAALTGLLAYCHGTDRQLAERAYLLADAMLAVREGKK